MTPAMAAGAEPNLLIHLLPLVAVVSLVYSATRHDEWPLIFRRAARLATLILAFMGLILIVLLGFQFWPTPALVLTAGTLAVLFLLQFRRPARAGSQEPGAQESGVRSQGSGAAGSNA